MNAVVEITQLASAGRLSPRIKKTDVITGIVARMPGRGWLVSALTGSISGLS
jgi:hypothetical protein